MFSLLLGLWNYLFSKAELHILIIGLDNAGKTTLLEQIKTIFGKKPGIPLDKIPPTVGLNLARVDIKRSRIIFWDLGGQERLRSIWSKYYSESHGLVFVIDSADEARFEEAKTTLTSMLSNSELEGIPLLVLSNKVDLQESRNVQAISTFFETEKLPGAVATHPISALRREGIEPAMNWLVDAVKNSDRYYEKASSAT